LFHRRCCERVNIKFIAHTERIGQYDPRGRLRFQQFGDRAAEAAQAHGETTRCGRMLDALGEQLLLRAPKKKRPPAIFGRPWLGR
jgi:hypothetical protein